MSNDLKYFLKRKVVFIKYAICISVLMINSILPQNLHGQIRAGSAYLKILPGTRQQSLASSLTGALDETYTLYANPGATGFLREWQWSASYNKWIADIFNLSLIYGKQVRFRTPWSDRLSVAFGLNYQGVGEFDATRGAQMPASAKDILLTTSVGMPISVLTKNLSFGTNIKFLRSELAQYNSSSWIFDFGIIYRTPRIRLSHSNTGLFEFGIISAGVSVNQLGNSMKFISEYTPLPRTIRAGLALNLGRHDGLQLQIVADYQKVYNENSHFGFGAEITNLLSPFSQSMGRIITLRGGYNFDDKRNTDLVSKYSIGLSLRLDDYMEAPLKRITPRNTEIRFDFGMIESKIFPQIYQGSITNRPIRPEHFEFVKSDYQSFSAKDICIRTYAVTDTVNLEWEVARDPDLYDDVNYILMVLKDSSRTVIDKIIEKSNRNEIDLFKFKESAKYKYTKDSTEIIYLRLDASNVSVKNDPFSQQIQDSLYIFVKDSSSSLVNNNLNRLNFKIYSDSWLEEGDYFWSVMAYDRNRHIRYVETDGSHVARFRVALPDLQITLMNKRKNGTEFYTDVLLKNSDRASVDDSFKVKVKVLTQNEYEKLAYEPVLVPGFFVSSKPGFSGIPDTTNKLIFDSLETVGITKLDKTFSNITTGDSLWIKNIQWPQDSLYMVAVIDFGEKINEFNEANNTFFDTLFVSDLEITKSAIVPPLKPNVFFDPVGSFTLSDAAKKELNRLSMAFKSSQFIETCIKIDGHTDEQGFRGVIDPDSNAALNLVLSINRIASVKNYLVDSLGIDSSRIAIQSFGQSRPLIPNANADSLHLINRRVEIYLLKKSCSKDSVDCSLINQAGCLIDTVKTANAGNEFKYVLTIRNNGPFRSRNFTVRDVIPDSITTSNFEPDTSRTKGKVLFWDFKSLAPDSVITIKYTTKVVSILPDTLIELFNLTNIIVSDDLNQISNSASELVYAIGGVPPQIDIPPVIQPNIHVVKRGEFLSIIAQKWSVILGYPISWQDIYEYSYVHLDSTNRQRIGNNPNSIKPGQVLVIPFESDIIPSAGIPGAQNGSSGKNNPGASNSVSGMNRQINQQRSGESNSQANLTSNGDSVITPKGPRRPWQRKQ